ncbi:MAG: type II toxin-antitoxin system RelE/ParE family toxin [Mycobacteriaceae bacterium]
MTEPFAVRTAPAARRQLHRLPTGVALAIAQFVTVTLPENPLRLTKPLVEELDGLRSARRGDYRVLVRVNEVRRVVLVVRIAHRAQAYRPPAP